ncbi:ATP-binding cassette domain-containing protein [Streptococcus sp. zg-86]|uniref:ATP-binding cassette domain-containing protein n=1 Tax=Streptococcus zhangguiae TaxID=2664091 RepID=A0A6I4RJA5_9STRE|nr:MULTISPECIES: ABC transporter ATP-binding protein [unclassified Streptococcus]MTB64900.1 ATP-binding cassette domain-containing protein [Streptococcus sp. zg-86]MTB91030.1 ATP-binding cassette domain-containing protein [Streptococcus sp. zg-36]MWV56887.1 ATP-binding cassette domain-containing protein [Streptococcus sp. zg-70]QTH48312.1 ABC transporter ATP-binding protein [Streptococcus sp. zg-86]
MILSMRNLSYRRQGKTILDNLSWEYAKGEQWAVLGLNGAGKSTLLRILTAEFWKSSGELSVLDIEFGKGDIPSLRTKIGIVGSFLAERFPTDLYAEQIVLTGKYKSSILYREYGEKELQEAKDMLDRIDAAHLIGRTYASLSQGERQLLLIARSLMEKPQLLILDEATVGLDLLARERLLKHIEQICQLPEAPAIIYVTHHAEEITQSFTHVLLLKEGRILAKGSKEDILIPDILSQFYDQQVELIPLGEDRLFIKPLI